VREENSCCNSFGWICRWPCVGFFFFLKKKKKKKKEKEKGFTSPHFLYLKDWQITVFSLVHL